MQMSNVVAGTKLVLIEGIYDCEPLDWCEHMFLIYILMESSVSCTDFISFLFS